ncbi:unnamed protein product, partial [Closterium sp. NIES-65]
SRAALGPRRGRQEPFSRHAGGRRGGWRVGGGGVVTGRQHARLRRRDWRAAGRRGEGVCYKRVQRGGRAPLQPILHRLRLLRQWRLSYQVFSVVWRRRSAGEPDGEQQHHLGLLQRSVANPREPWRQLWPGKCGLQLHGHPHGDAQINTQFCCRASASHSAFREAAVARRHLAAINHLSSVTTMSAHALPFCPARPLIPFPGRVAPCDRAGPQRITASRCRPSSPAPRPQPSFPSAMLLASSFPSVFAPSQPIAIPSVTHWGDSRSGLRRKVGTVTAAAVQQRKLDRVSRRLIGRLGAGIEAACCRSDPPGRRGGRTEADAQRRRAVRAQASIAGKPWSREREQRGEVGSAEGSVAELRGEAETEGGSAMGGAVSAGRGSGEGDVDPAGDRPVLCFPGGYGGMGRCGGAKRSMGAVWGRKAQYGGGVGEESAVWGRCACAVGGVANEMRQTMYQYSQHSPLLPHFLFSSPPPPPTLASITRGDNSGMFFYWQMGAAAAVSRHGAVDGARLVGASAGALAATLTACGVDATASARAAFDLSLANGVWDRPAGLAGVWGRLVGEWLDLMLPPDAHTRCTHRLSLHIVTLPSIRHRAPWFQRQVVSQFPSRADLIACCLASVHIPFFMDGRPWTLYRGRRCVDGSILAMPEHLAPASATSLFLDFALDEEMRRRRWDFLSLGARGRGGERARAREVGEQGWEEWARGEEVKVSEHYTLPTAPQHPPSSAPARTWLWIEEMMQRGEAYAMRELVETGLLHTVIPPVSSASTRARCQ